MCFQDCNRPAIERADKTYTEDKLVFSGSVGSSLKTHYTAIVILAEDSLYIIRVTFYFQ